MSETVTLPFEVLERIVTVADFAPLHLRSPEEIVALLWAKGELERRRSLPSAEARR